MPWLLRRALKCDPENREIRIAMAQVLTEMNRFEESNRILFALTRGGADAEADPECYFGMGCNFVGLYDYGHARDSFERYLELEPDGAFLYDAYDMLDALDDASLRSMATACCSFRERTGLRPCG